MKKPGRNDPCWCGSGKKYKFCHMSSDEKKSRSRSASSRRKGIIIKTTEEVEGIRAACRLTRETLDLVDSRIRPGITTEEINDWVHDFIVSSGGRPAPLNYRGFPKSVCTSINEEICHGIPGKIKLREGDIINVDVTAVVGGFYGDASRMYLMGTVSPEAGRLVQVSRECLYRGIRVVKPGRHFGDIGRAIQKHAERHGFSVVRDYTGHGVGVEFHEPPNVLHYETSAPGEEIRPGMVFTIEPMINAGTYRSRLLSNGWTAVTRDGKLSAQWEHTILVTESGSEILT